LLLGPPPFGRRPVHSGINQRDHENKLPQLGGAHSKNLRALWIENASLEKTAMATTLWP
jgi:hypothetical protein